jgi:hypothetical protein
MKTKSRRTGITETPAGTFRRKKIRREGEEMEVVVTNEIGQPDDALRNRLNERHHEVLRIIDQVKTIGPSIPNIHH